MSTIKETVYLQVVLLVGYLLTNILLKKED
jgi:hypothetical protein